MSVLSPEETQRVEAAIHQVEHTTVAEIVVTTLAQSERYVDVRLWTVLAVGVVGSALVHFILPSWDASLILVVQCALGLVTWFASGLAPVLRTLLPRQRARGAAERAAELAFFEQGVFATRERTGVLILLSELEHQAVILGDEGIHKRVQNDGWAQLVAQLTARIRERKAGEGLCELITRLGASFASQLPARDDDNPNELDNRVRSEAASDRKTVRLKPGDKPH